MIQNCVNCKYIRCFKTFNIITVLCDRAGKNRWMEYQKEHDGVGIEPYKIEFTECNGFETRHGRVESLLKHKLLLDKYELSEATKKVIKTKWWAKEVL